MVIYVLQVDDVGASPEAFKAPPPGYKPPAKSSKVPDCSMWYILVDKSNL